MPVKIDEQDFNKRLKETLEGIKFDVVNSLQDKLTPEQGRDTSVLISSIPKNSKVEGNTITIGMAEQGKWVEFGSPPHWPPFDEDEKSFPDLYGWVRRKWGAGSSDGDKENKKAAFLLARHISKFGTRPFPFIRNTFDLELTNIIRKNLKQAFNK